MASFHWVHGEESSDSVVMWLHGSAGAGKSAIAQRIAETCHEAELLASYFCSRLDPRCNHAETLFPTIAYQIACTIPEARVLIEQEIVRDPLIFNRSLEAQLLELIVKPLQPLVDSGTFTDLSSSPRLIILDGLDEILHRESHTEILKAISNVLNSHHSPLIFLIASRPEQEISFSFSIPPLSELTVV